jgi:hypothetical protein
MISITKFLFPMNKQAPPHLTRLATILERGNIIGLITLSMITLSVSHYIPTFMYVHERMQKIDKSAKREKERKEEN